MTSRADNISNPIYVIKKVEVAVTYLKKKWWLILLTAVIGGTLGYFLAQKKQVQYQSRLTFSLEEGGSGSSGGGIASIAAQFGISGINNSSTMFSGDNIMEILRSRRVIEGVLLSVDTFNNTPTTLIDFYIRLNNKERQGSKNYFPTGIKKQDLNYAQDSILYDVYSIISEKKLQIAKPDKNLDIFQLSFISLNEEFTKVFTDRILQETIKFYTELKTKKSKETLSILEARVSALRGNLDTSISARAFTQDANVNAAFSAAQIPIQKQQFNIQTYGAAYGELYKNLEVARYQFLQNTPLLQVIDGADYPMEQVRANGVKYVFTFSFVFVMMLLLLITIKKGRYKLI